MTSPLTIKVDVGVAEVIRTLDEINQRRQGRQREFLDDIADDLDAVHLIVNALDNLSLDITQGFAEREIIEDDNLLREHVRAAGNYLRRREIVPKLVDLQGHIELVSNDRRLRGRSGAPEMLSSLAQEIQGYLQSVQNYRVPSGVGYQELNEMRDMAEERLRGHPIGEAIIAKARQVLDLRSLGQSVAIQKRIGQVKALIA